MERMLCESCAAVSYSAAARQIVESAERCARCGGVLAVDRGERRDRGERVGVGGRTDPARPGFRERSES